MKVVLINPDIPWNAGNIGRTCVATNTELVFVGKLGFDINSKEIRRSGLDYWQYLKYSVFKTFEEFLETLGENPSLIFFSTRGKKTLWQAPYKKDSCLIFGGETSGFPLEYHQKYPDKIFRIPMSSSKIRSLNLSSSAAIVLYQAIRAVEI
ncbi:MAG: tRNA (cytidine(34)-2'-O)-methyltransferase [Elusimicrobiales bacterium]|nr:tRNA (cytidine(34)-2'-O)-methyltransferase [Elusimicrobiales bacterium]MCK5582802.1 tRNA (cytidine(34)-2'-O)-methyltransferase [Elusimicrobiales bacterium]